MTRKAIITIELPDGVDNPERLKRAAQDAFDHYYDVLPMGTYRVVSLALTNDEGVARITTRAADDYHCACGWRGSNVVTCARSAYLCCPTCGQPVTSSAPFSVEVRP